MFLPLTAETGSVHSSWWEQQEGENEEELESSARGLSSLLEGRIEVFTVCEQEPRNLLAESTGVTSLD